MDAPVTPEAGVAGDLGLALTSADKARLELEGLKQDSTWVAKHLAGSEETKQQVLRLAEEMTRLPEGSLISGNPTLDQQRNHMADYFAEFGPGLSAGVIEEVRQGTPNPAGIYQEAMTLKRSLLADPAWVQKYMAGDHDARRKLTLINIIEANGVRLNK